MSTAAARTEPSSSITDWSATELARRIGMREVSCREVMLAYLAQIERFNPQVNALHSLLPAPQLLAQADARDAQLARGEPHGWLHGFPAAPKDLTSVAGLATTFGSPLFKQHVPSTDSVMAARLRAAGAIFIGRSNTPEMGLGSHTYNPLHGRTGNAFDPKKSAGGSSGGAAVALALHMLPVADGSDMMGSLRNPAGWNNVFGLRPSTGRVPYGPGPEVFMSSLSTEGPMARSVADLARLLAVQAGYDARLPLALGDDPKRFAEPLDAAFDGTRIGWLGDHGGYLATEPGLLPRCEQALAHFETIGCKVDAVQPDFSLPRLWKAWTALRSFQIAGSYGALYADPKRRAQMKLEMQWEIEQGLSLSGAEVYRASAERSAWLRALLALFGDVDYLVLPSAQVFAFDLKLDWPHSIGGRAMDSYHRWMEVVIGASMAGLPALGVPAGFGPGGVPIGLQLIGRPRADFELLQLGHAYEQACGYTRVTSPLLEQATAQRGLDNGRQAATPRARSVVQPST